MDWTADAWNRALLAMRDQSSAAEIIALYEGGAITAGEVFNGAWSQCFDNPVLRAKLVQQFRTHEGTSCIARIGDELEDFAAKVSANPC